MTLSTPTYADESLVSQYGQYTYDARMAFLKAGELSLGLRREGGGYEVLGEFKTSRAMSAYYTWNGVFAAVGKWRPWGPVTTAYMARTSGKDADLKVVLTYPNGTRVLEGADETFQSVERPGGIDLISALFFNPGCYAQGLVHDGEDNYDLSLRSEKHHELKGGRAYYSGAVVSCDYSVQDHKQRKRRVVVSLAEIDGSMMAVQVRAKIPFLPDAVFRLRMPPLTGAPVASATP